MDDEQKAILEKAVQTGEVSVSDYKAAWDRYATCVQDRGYKRPTMKVYSNGVQQPQSGALTAEQGASVDFVQKMADDLDACTVAHVEAVDKLYTAQVGNPSLYASYDDGTVDCLKRGELVPQSYTVEQYQSEKNNAAHVSPGETPETTYDPSDPDVLACLAANGNIFADAPTQ